MMAPAISILSCAEEKTVLNSLLRHYPSLRVDMLSASPAVKQGENFMSVATKIDIVGRDSTTGEREDVSLIMKTLPTCEGRLEVFHCETAFQNEAGFYGTVLPCLRALSPAKLAFPPCLLATPSTIILRHLGQDGYKIVDRRQGLDLSHCLLVMMELGKYHAVSLATKYQHPEEFDKIKFTAKEFFITKDNTTFSATVDNCVDMIQKVGTNIDSSTNSKLESIKGNGFHVLSPHSFPSEPLAVITHGDLWSNNLLFRYSTEDSKTPVEVCFLDLQGSRYASLALDILYFLFSSSSPGVLKQNFRLLLTTYQHTLQNTLELLAPLAPTVTLPTIMNELKIHGVFGLIMSTMVLAAATAEDFTINLDDVDENVLKSDDFKKESEKFLLTPEFKRRLNENLEVFSLENLI